MTEITKPYANFLIYDIEAGGLDKKKNPICEIAWICIDGYTLEEKFRYQTHVQNYEEFKSIELPLVYTDKAMEINGITQAQIKSGITRKELMKKMLEDVKEAKGEGKFNSVILVGHNIVKFDNKFIRYAVEKEKVDLFKYIDEVFEDTLLTAKKKWFSDPSMLKYKLSDCCEKLGIQINDAHGAMGDVEANTELFKSFIRSLRSDGENVGTEITSFRSSFQF